MKKRLPVLLVCLILICGQLGCGHSPLPISIASRTDYISGGRYRINRPVFLFKPDKSSSVGAIFLVPPGFSGTPADAHTWGSQLENDPQVIGWLSPGDEIQVSHFREQRSIILGVFLQVFAVATTGKHKGVNFEISMISRDRSPNHSIYMDDEFLSKIAQ